MGFFSSVVLMAALAAGPDLRIKELPVGTVVQVMSANLGQILDSGTVQKDRTLVLKALAPGQQLSIWFAIPTGKTPELISVQAESTQNDLLLRLDDGPVSLRTYLKVNHNITLLLRQ